MRFDRRLIASLLALSCAALIGCTGDYRETTTGRTATEMLIVSTAAQRAVKQYDARSVAGRRVAIDDSMFESVDKPYVMSALRQHLAEAGGVIVAKDADPAPDLHLEIRSGSLGINDDSFGIGLPPLPLPVPQTNLTSVTPALYLFNRDKQEGWAKFQFWVYDPATKAYVSKSGPLWGTAYLSRWWILFAGPFEFSNDIYPEGDLLERAGHALE